MPTVRECVTKLIDKGITDKEAIIKTTIKQTGCTYDTVRRCICGNNVWHKLFGIKYKSNGKVKETSSKSVGRMSAVEFLEKVDRSTQVRKTLESFLSDIDGVWREIDLRVAIGYSVGTAEVRAVLDDPKYNKYKLIVRNEVYWTTPKQRDIFVEKILAARPYTGSSSRR